MRKRRAVEGGREERRSALEGGEKRGGGNKRQWLINLFVYNEQRKSSRGLEKPDDNKKRKIIIYIVSCPSFCLSFCKVRKEKKSQKRKYRYILKQVKHKQQMKIGRIKD